MAGLAEGAVPSGVAVGLGRLVMRARSKAEKFFTAEEKERLRAINPGSRIPDHWRDRCHGR